MKQKKKNEKSDKQETKKTLVTEKNIAVNKKKSKDRALLKNIGCMLLMPITIALAAFLGSLFSGADLYYMVRNITLCLSAALAVVFSFQAGRVAKSFFYDDGEYPERFLSLYLCGILCALIFTRLPVTGWMFLFFFVALARVSDSVTGALGGTSLLVLTTVLCEQMSLSTFLVYLLSGMIGITLFAHQKDEFYTAIPLALTLGCQLLLIFGGELLVQNKKLMWEAALVPFANIVMNGILLCIFLQYYINKVAKKVDNLYLRLNDPEYTVMARIRENEKEDYYCSIHTAYLVERITSEMGLDVRSAKCLAYYGHLPKEMLEEIPFPEPAAALMAELKAGGRSMKSKETVIVRICYTLIRGIQMLREKNNEKKADYTLLINRMFEQQFTIEHLAETDITLSNLRYIQKRLTEEKMYYEFMV